MILSKSQLVNNINNEISDQAYSQISPEDIRHNLIDIVDSIHNLTYDKEILALNIATLPSGNTKLGQEVLELFNLSGYSGKNNTGIGYSSLKSTYQGSRNTAVGSYSLSCNVYGDHNVAIGHNALAGNTVGSLNIGIGSYTLHHGKSGLGNIAIGHGAGFYIDKKSDFKLFIASHVVDSGYICDNPLGSGLTPLIHGDLSGIKLGIGLRHLHNYGMLQVAGDITPSGNASSSLGHSLYPWQKLFVSHSINFSNSSSFFSSGTSTLGVTNSILPNTTDLYLLGSPDRIWKSGCFNNVTVTGTATIDRAIINQLNYISLALYSSKNFYLGVNNSNQPIFSDSQLNDGGIFLKSTTTYQGSSKEYSIAFRPPSEGMQCFADAYNAVWYSNINFQVPSNRYIKTNSIVCYDPPSFSNNDCFGLFFNSGITYISRKNVLNVNPGLPNGHIAGIGNINFISNSGEVNNYSLSLSSLESGVSVSQRFLTGTKSRVKDTVTNKDKLSGFEIKYIDDSLSDIFGPLSDRFLIGSYNNTSQFVNATCLMKNSEDGGVFGITNIPSVTENILPNTIFNVRSKNDCIARFTAENNGYYKSAVQLLGTYNCLSSGLEIAYLNNSGIGDISIYKNAFKTTAIRITDSGRMGIFSSGITNETITIGHSGMFNLPVISLKDTLHVTDSGVVASSGYGKIYNIRSDKAHARQNNDLVFMDTSGNQFNLVVNKFDNVDARAVYTDTNGNAFAGYLTPSGRLNITSAIRHNTLFGNHTLTNIVSGSGNTCVGYDLLSTLSSGNNNIIVGSYSASGVNASNNIIIGSYAFNKQPNLSNTSGNIVIGHHGVGNSVSGSYNFVVGSRESVILLEGKLGPSNNDKSLTLPSGGKLYIHNSNNTESLGLKTNIIEVIDSGGSNYPDNDLTFRFWGINSGDLLVLNHSAQPLTNIATYAPHRLNNDLSVTAPYARLNGDLQLRGYIHFSDYTSLKSASGINRTELVADSGLAIANSGIHRLNTFFIEGFAKNTIPAPSNGQKTSGVITPKTALWADSGSIYIINRDTTSVIHSGAYVIAARVNNEYKPIWISSEDTSCSCCNK
jgi:hypothetical protein